MPRVTQDTLSLKKLERQKTLLQFGNMVIMYVVALGILQFIAALFRQDISLQAPIIVIIYAAVIYLMIPILSVDVKDFFDILTNKTVLVSLLIVMIGLILTPILAPGLIPKIFSIVG